MWLVWLVGCGTSEQAAPGAGTVAVTPAAAPVAAAPAAAEPSVEALCGSTALLLTRHRWEDLQRGGYCAMCKPYDEYACEFDWPTNDVPACEQLDLWRNEILARKGWVFKRDDYRAWFEKQPWYRPDPNYKGDGLTPIEEANIAHLKRMVAEKRACESMPGFVEGLLHLSP